MASLTRPTAGAVLAVLAACTGNITDGSGGGGAAGDHTPPAIAIESPDRGTMQDGTRITVTGTVADADSDVAEVRVNGQVADLAGGRFTIEIEAGVGIQVLTTQATDTAGNAGTDHRAVLMGPLAPQGTAVSDGIVARIDGQAMTTLAAIISDAAEHVDLTTLARAQNPVAVAGDGCNGARAYVDGVSRTSIPMTVTPATGGMAARVQVQGLRVDGHVDFSALCINGSAGWTITATSYDVGGDLRPSLSAGDISVSLANVTSAFNGFNLSVGVVPDFVVDLFEGQVRAELARILREKIVAMVPPMANDFLADFVRDSWTAYALGREIDVSTNPTAMAWTTEGGRIELETATEVRDAQGAMYVPTPMPAPSSLGAAGLSVAVADDVANQLLAGMWAAGAFDQDAEPAIDDPVRAFFEGVDRIKVTTLLPPMVDADTTTGTLKLMVGDAVAEILDEDGVGTIARFAISADVDLAGTLDANGRFEVQTGSPLVIGQILEQSPSLLTPLDAAKVEAFGSLAIAQMARQADELLGVIPIPGIGGELRSPTFDTQAGYVVMGATVSAP